MGASVSTLHNEMSAEERSALLTELLSKCRAILEDNPGNRCCKHVVTYLSSEEGKALSNTDVQVFYKCIKSGLENPTSSLGCYAMTPGDYTTFSGFFDELVRDYHGDTTRTQTHVTDDDWTIDGTANYDVTKLKNVDPLRVRVSVRRNLKGFNLPGKMTKRERIEFELKILPAFQRLNETCGGGTVHSLTPRFAEPKDDDDDAAAATDNPNLISPETHRQLVRDGIMFRDAFADPYLESAGIGSDWPYGRGCWRSDDGSRIVMFGGEDLLQVICVSDGTAEHMSRAFRDVKEILRALEDVDGIEFARDERYGYVTSCPSHLGTGMKASVYLKVPNLIRGGTDERLKEVCTPLGFSVRGIGGEGIPIEEDGAVNVSSSATLFVTESDIITKLCEGTEKILVLENDAATMEGLERRQPTQEDTVMTEDTTATATATEDVATAPPTAIAKNDTTPMDNDEASANETEPPKSSSGTLPPAEKESTVVADGDSNTIEKPIETKTEVGPTTTAVAPPAATTSGEIKTVFDVVKDKHEENEDELIRRRGSLPPVNTINITSSLSLSSSSTTTTDTVTPATTKPTTMAAASPRTLNMSPSPTLAITDDPSSV